MNSTSIGMQITDLNMNIQLIRLTNIQNNSISSSTFTKIQVLQPTEFNIIFVGMQLFTEFNMNIQ